MKFLRLLFAFLVFTSAAFAEKRPEWAFDFAFKAEGSVWLPSDMDVSRKGVRIELIPEGQTKFSWKEKVIQQVLYNRDDLAAYLKDWQKGLKKEAPDAQVTTETLPDGSLLVSFISKNTYDSSLRRIFKMSDGIYIMAFHVRPLLRTPAREQALLDMIRNGRLKPNEHAKK